MVVNIVDVDGAVASDSVDSLSVKVDDVAVVVDVGVSVVVVVDSDVDRRFNNDVVARVGDKGIDVVARVDNIGIDVVDIKSFDGVDITNFRLILTIFR